jgi:hypothetical protein
VFGYDTLDVIYFNLRGVGKDLSVKILCFIVLAFGLSSAHAQEPSANAYPSCNLAEQRSLAGDLSGTIRDPGQAHISMRANILQADISTARKARRVSQPTADQLWKEVQRVRADADVFTRKQGFLSAAERATYDRQLDTVAARICP